MEKRLLGFFGGQQWVVDGGQNLFQFDVVADTCACQVGFLARLSIGRQADVRGCALLKSRGPRRDAVVRNKDAHDKEGSFDSGTGR